MRAVVPLPFFRISFLSIARVVCGGFGGLAVGLAERLHLVLEAGSHGSSGGSSRGGCGGGVYPVEVVRKQ